MSINKPTETQLAAKSKRIIIFKRRKAGRPSGKATEERRKAPLPVLSVKPTQGQPPGGNTSSTHSVNDRIKAMRKARKAARRGHREDQWQEAQEIFAAGQRLCDPKCWRVFQADPEWEEFDAKERPRLKDHPRATFFAYRRVYEPGKADRKMVHFRYQAANFLVAYKGISISSLAAELQKQKGFEGVDENRPKQKRTQRGWGSWEKVLTISGLLPKPAEKPETLEGIYKGCLLSMSANKEKYKIALARPKTPSRASP